MYSQKRQRGNVGEEFAVKLLWGSGYHVLRRNYLKKCGEIDIIAEKDGVLHFIEIKSSFVSCETSAKEDLALSSKQNYRPEENVSIFKLAKLHKTIEIFQNEFNCRDQEFCIDVLVLIICDNELVGHRWIYNVI